VPRPVRYQHPVEIAKASGGLPRPEALLCGIGDGCIEAHKRPFGIAELSRAVAPRHHLRLLHHFQLILQPCELGFHVIDLELDDGGAIGGGLSASLLNNATVSALPIASVAAGVTISANTGASHSAVWPVTFS